MSFLDLLDWEDGIYHGLNSFLGQQRHNFSRECGGDGDLLIERSRAQDRTYDVETFAQDLIEIDLSLTTCHSTDKDDPAPQCCGFEARGEIRTAIQIEYNVESSVAGHAPGKSSKPR